MTEGFLIAVEWVTYMVSVPWPTVHVLSRCGTGHKLSFERDACIWWFDSACWGVPLDEAAWLSLEPVSSIVSPSASPPEQKGSRQWGLIQGWPSTRASRFIFPVEFRYSWSPSTLLLSLPVPDFWWLAKTRKREEERGRSSLLRFYHTVVQVLPICNGTNSKTWEAHLIAFKKVPSIDS